MIKIDKDLSDVPASLNDSKTIVKRDVCIRNYSYPSSKYAKNFDKRYKQKDVKEKLEQIYKNKCAFCEKKVMQCMNNNMDDCTRTIEHYRPKSIYYWLAYSWDNLLLCCNRCNKNKDNNFDIKNNQIKYNPSFLSNIHTSSKSYNTVEEPLIIHPEFEGVVDKISFDKNGKIYSKDSRVMHTIEICKLNRDSLIEDRKTIIDEFINKINAKLVTSESVSDILLELINDIKLKEKEFIALRYWLLSSLI